MDALSLANAAAAGISRRIFNAPEFDAILPMNDYPQSVRWAVSKRSTIAEIISRTNASITQKGQFCQEGDQLLPGAEKLHLLVEGHTFADVELAMRELCRLLPGGGIAFSGGREQHIACEMPAAGKTFRLVLPGYRCEKCKVEFWTVEDARLHIAEDNAGDK